MSDQFGQFSTNLDSPARDAFAITPDDDIDLAIFTRGIYIGGNGTLVIRTVGSDTNLTFVGVVAGSVLPLRCKRILATGTTATNLVGLV